MLLEAIAGQVVRMFSHAFSTPRFTVADSCECFIVNWNCFGDRNGHLHPV